MVGVRDGHARANSAQLCNIIEAPWLVNGGHGASFRHHTCRTQCQKKVAEELRIGRGTPCMSVQFVGVAQGRLGVSDKMKKAQPFRCLEKDQSFHLFQLP